MKFLERVFFVLKQKFFHGDIDTPEAIRRLSHQPEGSCFILFYFLLMLFLLFPFSFISLHFFPLTQEPTLFDSQQDRQGPTPSLSALLSQKFLTTASPVLEEKPVTRFVFLWM